MFWGGGAGGGGGGELGSLFIIVLQLLDVLVIFVLQWQCCLSDFVEKVLLFITLLIIMFVCL